MPAQPQTTATELGAFARHLYQERRARANLFGCDWLREGGWDLLLDLYASTSEGRQVSIKSACLAACIPTSTGQRLVAQLENDGLIERLDFPKDRRVRHLRLSERATNLMAQYLQSVIKGRSRFRG